MDKLGIKGTLYDFLGYIVPGLTFIVGLALVLLCKDCADRDVVIKNFMDVNVSVPMIMLLLVASYILGHTFSSLSSWLFERDGWNLSLIKCYELDPKKVGERYRPYYDKIFGDGSEIDFLSVVAYSQERTKAVYETAFVFLSIYGFSRNTSMALLFALVSNCVVLDYTAWNWWVLLGAVFCIITLLHNYFRFRKYYIERIFSSLIVPLK